MIYELNNGILRVKVSSTGAELKSIKETNDARDVEYLWQLNPEIWERQAPLLFPVIGRLRNEEYFHNCYRYNIDIHGFARFEEFNVSKPSESELNLTIESNENTKKIFPFDFRLQIKCRIDENCIVKEHVVFNTGMNDMYYEIGGHEFDPSGYGTGEYDSHSSYAHGHGKEGSPANH